MMRTRNRLRTVFTLAIVAIMVIGPTANAGVVFDGSDFWNSTGNPVTGTFDASGSDKLVVVVTGEHGFNNTDGNCMGITYDGVALTQAVNRDPVASSTDTLYNDIWYLDNPATSTGEIIASVSSRGNVTVFGLSGTAPGVGATAISASHQRSVDLTTTGDGSIVIASFGIGGGGNTAGIGGVSADAPLIQTSAQENGNNWDGHITGYAIVPTAGADTYSFTGGDTSGAVVIAAEFLSGVTGTLIWDGHDGVWSDTDGDAPGDSHWDGGALDAIPSFVSPDLTAAFINTGSATVTSAAQGAYTLDVAPDLGDTGTLSIIGGELTVPLGMTSTTELTVGDAGKLTTANGTLAGVTIGTAGGSVGTIDTGIGGEITATNLTILDNSTLAVQGSGTLSFSGTSTVSATGTSVKVSGGSLLELASAPLGVNSLQMDGGSIKLIGELDMTATPVIVTDNSGLEVVTATTGAFGALSFNGQGILTTSGADGSISFTSTTITSPSDDLGFNTLSDTHAGPIDFNGTGATIIKTGDADLILNASAPTDAAGAGFDVKAGRLIAQGGATLNSLGAGSALGVNGGEVVLTIDTTDTAVTFDNPLTSTGGTLTAGGANAGPVAVTLGNEIGNDVTLTSGNLLIQTAPDYTLNIAGAVTGSGDMTVGADTSVVVTQGTIDAGVITIDGSLTTNNAVTVRGLIANAGGVYAATGTNKDLIVTETLTLNSGIDMSTATLNVDGAAVTVSNGLLAVGNNLGVVTPVASVDVSNAGGLTLNGNSLTAQKLVTTGGVFDMGATGSFIATGDVAATAGAGPELVTLSGGTLSVSAPAIAAQSIQFDLSDNNGSYTGHESPGFAQGDLTDTDNTWNTLWADTAAGLLYSDGTDATGVQIDLGQGGGATVNWANGVAESGAGGSGIYDTAVMEDWIYSDGGDNLGARVKGLTPGNYRVYAMVREPNQLARTYDVSIGMNIDTLDGSPTAITDAGGITTWTVGKNYAVGDLTVDSVDDWVSIIIDPTNADWGTLEGLQIVAMDSVGAGAMSTDLQMTAATVIDVASSITLGDLSVNNAPAAELNFTGDAENRLVLNSTTFDNTPTGLTVNTTSKVNLGTLNLAGAVDPAMTKIGTGQWIITESVAGDDAEYTGTATVNVNAGTLTLGDTGLIGAGTTLNVADGATLKLSSTIAARTYAEPITLTSGATILAGMADSNAAETAVVTLPTLPTDITKSVTLGTTDEGYTLEVAGAVTADSLSLGGVGTVKLTSGGTVNNAIVSATGTINVPTALTVANKITLGDIEITDDANMQITGSNLTDPTGTVTLSGTAPVIAAPVAEFTGLLGSWTFDDATVNDSDGLYTSTNVNGVISTDVPTALAGGNSIDLNANGYIKVDDGTATQDVFNLTGTMTVAFWAKEWPADSWGAYVTKRGENGRGWQVRKDGGSATNMAFTLRGTPGDDDWDKTVPGAMADWTHIIATYGDGFRRLYADNQLIGELAETGDIAAALDGEFLLFGARDNNDGDSFGVAGYSKAKMDDIYIFDKVISEEERTQLFTNSAGGFAPIDMPGLNVDLAMAGPTAAVTINAETATLGDLTMGAITDLTITGTEAASFNNVTVNATPSTIGGTVLSTTIRGKLQTAGGTDLTSSVAVSGNLTMAAGSSTNVAGGAITAGSLTHAGGTNTIAAGSTVNVTSLNVTGGTLNAAPATLAVETLATIGEHVVAENTGAAFNVSGSDVLAARTLTLNGGTMNLTGEFLGDPVMPTITGLQAHFDASVGVTVDGSNNVTLWADQSGNGRDAVTWEGTGNLTAGEVNGLPAVKFGENENLLITGTEFFAHDTYLVFRSDSGTTTFGPNSGGWGSPLGPVDNGDDNDRSWMFDGGTTQFWGNESPGAVTWNGEVIPVTNESSMGARDMSEYMVLKVTAGAENNLGVVREYSLGTRNDQWSNLKFATAEVLAFDRALDAAEEGDLGVYLAAKYGIGTAYTAEVELANTAMMLANTTIATTVSSTVTIPGADSLVLGGTATAAGTALTIASATPAINMSNLTVAGGSMVRSTQAATVEDVDVTVTGTLAVDGDGVSYLGDTGEHAVILGDGDDNYTNLTLSDGAVLDWTLTGNGADDNYLQVNGLTTQEGSLTVNILDGGGTAAGDNVTLLYSILGVAPAGPPTVTLGTLPDDWTAGTLEWVFAGDGPTQWALVLNNLVAGTVVTPQDPGDTNGDRIVDAADMLNFQDVFGLEGQDLLDASEELAVDPFDADFDDDGDADLDDFVTLRQYFGTDFNPTPPAPVNPAATPEPATMSLLALGGLAILRRRRRK